MTRTPSFNRTVVVAALPPPASLHTRAPHRTCEPPVISNATHVRIACCQECSVITFERDLDISVVQCAMVCHHVGLQFPQPPAQLQRHPLHQVMAIRQRKLPSSFAINADVEALTLPFLPLGLSKIEYSLNYFQSSH